MLGPAQCYQSIEEGDLVPASLGFFEQLLDEGERCLARRVRRVVEKPCRIDVTFVDGRLVLMNEVEGQAVSPLNELSMDAFASSIPIELKLVAAVSSSPPPSYR